MTTWDGTDFRSVDDDGIGDGTTDTTMPLDTILEHSVRNQQMYVRGRDAGASVSPIPAKVASVDWSLFWGGWIPIAENTDTVRVIVIMEVGTDDSGGTNPDSEYSVATRLRLGQDPETESIIETDLTGGSDTTVTHEIDLSDDFVGRWTRINLEVKSGIGSSASSGDDLISIRGDGEFNVDTASGGISDHGVAFCYKIGGDQPAFEEVRNDSDARMWMSGPAYKDRGEWGGSSTNGNAFWMGWIKPKTIILEVDRDKSVDIDSSQIAHRIPYEAQWSSYKHARAATSNYSRPRCVTIGNEELFNWDDTHWGTGTTQAWTGSAKIDGQSDNESNGTLKIMYSYIGHHAVADYRPAITKGDADEIIKDITKDKAGVADLTVTLTVQQLADGDTSWASPSLDQSTSATKEIDLFPTDETGAFPVLQQLRHMRLNNAGDTTEDETVNHEGRLWWDRDRAFVRRGSISLEITESSFDFEKPCRLKLDFSLSDIGLSRGIPSSQRSDDRAGVLLTDVTGWWYPA